MRCNDILESITQVAQVHGGSVVSRCNEGGVVRMKIMVRKKEVKQLLAMMGNGENNTHQASVSLEQRLQAMRRRHLRRVEQVKEKGGPWRPALKSIPEEH